VLSATNTQSINLGERVTLNSVGMLEQAVTGGDKQSLSFFSESSNNLYPVISGCFMKNFLPIFISDSKVIKGGKKTMVPKECIMIWLSEMEMGTIIESVPSVKIEANFNNTRKISVLYQKQEWSTI